MTVALSPVEIVQNPAFGSIIHWNFARAYQAESASRLPSFEVFFLVLPLVLHARSLEHVSSTLPGSGLGKLVSKLAQDREVLLAVHYRTFAMRALTLQSIGTGVSTKILSLNYELATIRANEGTLPRTPERIKKHLTGADKLGRWFARLSAKQVFALLQVNP